MIWLATFGAILWKIGQLFILSSGHTDCQCKKYLKNEVPLLTLSVARLGELFALGQLYKAFGKN